MQRDIYDDKNKYQGERWCTGDYSYNIYVAKTSAVHQKSSFGKRVLIWAWSEMDSKPGALWTCKLDMGEGHKSNNAIVLRHICLQGLEHDGRKSNKTTFNFLVILVWNTIIDSQSLSV